MNQLTIWLATFGITFSICDAKLLSPLRDRLTSRSVFFYELTNCYMCTGFWVSLFVHAMLNRDVALGLADYVESLGINAFAGATFCYALNSLILTLESYHDRNHPQE